MSMGETDGVRLKARPFPGQIAFLFANLFVNLLFHCDRKYYKSPTCRKPWTDWTWRSTKFDS